MEAIELRRHGDVLFKTKVGFTIPAEVNLKKEKLVHGGNNHDHFLDSPQLLGEIDGKKFLRAEEDTFISHAEHGNKPLPRGDYWVEIQTFYDHLAEEAKQVID